MRMDFFSFGLCFVILIVMIEAGKNMLIVRLVAKRSRIKITYRNFHISHVVIVVFFLLLFLLGAGVFFFCILVVLCIQNTLLCYLIIFLYKSYMGWRWRPAPPLVGI